VRGDEALEPKDRSPGVEELARESRSHGGVHCVRGGGEGLRWGGGGADQVVGDGRRGVVAWPGRGGGMAGY